VGGWVGGVPVLVEGRWWKRRGLFPGRSCVGSNDGQKCMETRPRKRGEYGAEARYGSRMDNGGAYGAGIDRGVGGEIHHSEAGLLVTYRLDHCVLLCQPGVSDHAETYRRTWVSLAVRIGSLASLYALRGPSQLMSTGDCR